MVDRTRITTAEYSQLPETNKPMALIDGQILHIPVPKYPHQHAVGNIHLFLSPRIPGGHLVLSPMDVFLDDWNVVQPDLFWVSGRESLCKLGEDGWWHGAPDLVIEILSDFTELLDRRDKFNLYQKYGVREGWFLNTDSRLIEVYTLINGKFERQGVYGAEDTFISATLGGLEIPVGKLI
jgi:Uma2 family endonuclease